MPNPRPALSILIAATSLFCLDSLLWWHIGHTLWPTLPNIVLLGLIILGLGAPALPYAAWQERYKRWRLQRKLKNRLPAATVLPHYTTLWVSPEVLTVFHNCQTDAAFDYLLLKTMVQQLQQASPSSATHTYTVPWEQQLAKQQFHQQVLATAQRVLNQEPVALCAILPNGQPTIPLYINTNNNIKNNLPTHSPPPP